MKYAILILVAAVLVVALSGCSTFNGLCRDVGNVADYGARVSQRAVDQQAENSIAYEIREQNRIINRGRNIELALQN